jgi:hypothetical protein
MLAVVSMSRRKRSNRFMACQMRAPSRARDHQRAEDGKEEQAGHSHP